MDEGDVIMKRNTVDTPIIIETQSKDDTLNLGSIQGHHTYNKIREDRKGVVRRIYIKDTAPMRIMTSPNAPDPKA